MAMSTLLPLLISNTAFALLFAAGATLASWRRAPGIAHVLWLLVLLKLVSLPLWHAPLLPAAGDDRALAVQFAPLEPAVPVTPHIDDQPSSGALRETSSAALPQGAPQNTPCLLHVPSICSPPLVHRLIGSPRDHRTAHPPLPAPPARGA